MNGSNKILTVSYGTFSCTLEGFDDPFNSMKSIAEYFRDLAADDRYFGAEPPTPDVEMLQNLAERESRRRVEARLSDHGVALSVADAQEKVAERTPDTAQPSQDTTGPLVADDNFVEDEPEDALVLGETDDAPSDLGPAETIAEKLSRIRAVVSRSTLPMAEDIGTLDGPAVEAPRSRALTQTLDDIAADIAGEDEDLEDDTPAAEDASDDDWNMMEEDDASGDDGDAEPLLSDDAGPALDKAEDDEHEVAKTSAEVANIAEALAREAAEAREELLGSDEGRRSALGGTGERQGSEKDDLAGVRRDTDEPAESDDNAGIEAEDHPGGAEPATAGGSAGTLEQDLGTPQDETRDDAGDRADDTDDALAAAEPWEGPGIETLDEDPTDARATLDPTDDEGAGQAILAAAARAEDEAAAPARRESRGLGPVDDEGDNVGRLMHETEGKMADDDGVRRRRVISQMRAAVAATRADKILSRMATSRDTAAAESPYRSDLDHVVRTRSDKAPLVLVSELRIDGKAEEKTPRSDEDFGRFARDMGADDLPDLLEAAAAYAAFVEGQPHFSRPEIMRRVAGTKPELALSREAGLRSFGQLLREGKIRKLQRGQFTIDEATRFNPAHRIAGE